MMVIGRNLPTVIQGETQAEAEWLASTHQIRELGQHTARTAEENEQTATCMARVQAGARPMAPALLAADGDHLRLADRSAVSSGVCLGAMRAEVSRRRDDAWRNSLRLRLRLLRCRSRSTGWSIIISACRIGDPPCIALPRCCWRSTKSRSRNLKSRTCRALEQPNDRRCFHDPPGHHRHTRGFTRRGGEADAGPQNQRIAGRRRGWSCHRYCQ